MNHECYEMHVFVEGQVCYIYHRSFDNEIFATKTFKVTHEKTTGRFYVRQ